MIQYPPAENDVHLHSMITIGQFFKHLITVCDVVEFDEILREINCPKVNQLVNYEPGKVSTISLDQISFHVSPAMNLRAI